MDPSKNPMEDPPQQQPQPTSSRAVAAPTSPIRIPGSHGKENGSEDENALCEMIDKVLNPQHDADAVAAAAASEASERFNMSLVHDNDAGVAAAPEPKRFNERDYQSHRRESFPHIHHPLRPLHSRSLRKKLVTSPVKHGSAGGTGHYQQQASPGAASPPIELSSSPSSSLFGLPTITVMGGSQSSGGNNNEDFSIISPTSTASSSPSKSPAKLLASPTAGGSIETPSSFSSRSGHPLMSPFSPTSHHPPPHQQHHPHHHHQHNQDVDVEPEEAYESCPLLGEPDVELYNLDLAGEVRSVGHVPTTAQSASSPVPGPFDDLIEPVKKVQFEIGGSPVDGSLEVQHERRKHRKHSHHHIKYEDPQWRLRQGSELIEEGMQLQRGYAAAADELALSQEISDMDRDELAAHRFGDNKGFRRHRFFFNKATEEIIHPGVTVITEKPDKPVYDHQPHEVYVELDVLHVRGHSREWKETARWIKYEEDLEEGADRWGRPHIASLSFHSLINLRRLIEGGVTMLDLEERDLPGVAYRVVSAMAVKELISDEDKPLVMKSLLSKHKHVNDDDRPWRFHLTRRNTQSGSLTSLHAMLEDRNRHNRTNAPLSNVEAAFEGLTRRSSAASRLGGNDAANNDFPYSPTHNKNGGHVSSPRSISFRGPFSFATSATDTNLNQHKGQQHVAISLAKFSLSNLSEEDVKWITNKENILRRIPLGAEASIVLVGQDDALEQPVLAFVRLAEAVIMPNTTELPIPVRFIFIVLGPPSIDLDYKEIGRSISTLMSNTHFHEIAYKANDRKDLLKGIHEFLDESIVLPPGEWDGELFPFEELREKSQALRRQKERRRSLAKGLLDPGDGDDGPPGGDDEDDPLRRTRRPFGGLVNDVRRRYPKYISDITDGFNFQTVACIIFIYFAAVSGAIAFGGILSEKTESHIGISETLMASAGAGVIFSLLSGQPLIIVGTTGPLLLFDTSLYEFCKSQNVDYLGFRLWVGIWVAIIGTLAVALEGSFLARYFTRFVQEIYSGLISLLFVYESIEKLVKVYEAHPLQMTYGTCNASLDKVSESEEQPNTALLTTILCLGTFIIAYMCRGVRDSDYLTLGIRKFLGNFAVPIAIVVMVGLDLVLVNHAKTDKLKVPQGLSNSKPRDSWFVDATTVPVSMAMLASVPAFLVFILIFMETSICGRLIAKKDNKLKKGGGFHLDILLISAINAFCSSIGGCWVCAATVRAVAHTTSLVVYSTNNPPGEKPVILGVTEQRVSNFMVSVLIGLSVLMSPVLVLIPMAVLFGVFLYMGISSMRGVQFFDRVALLFKQVSNHPQIPYVRRVRTSKMHLFTTIQICCLAVLWVVKSSPLALAVPFVLLLLVPFRMLVMTKMFKQHELAALDSDGSEPPANKRHLEPKDLAAAVTVIEEDGNMNKLHHQNGNGTVKNGIPDAKELRSIW